MRDHRTALTILGHASLVTASDNRKLDTLETHEPLTNVVVGRRINHPPLSIAKELIQSVVSCAFSDLVRVVVHVLSLVYSIINRPIGRVLRRSAVKSARVITRVLLTICCIGPHVVVWVITTCCSSESLQVSDHLAWILLIATAAAMGGSVRLRRAKQYRVIGMGLDVLLEILRSLECLTAEVALVRLQRDVNTDV